MSHPTQTAETIARDFDRIARFADYPWDHNRRYHSLLLRALPARFGSALDIGCGTGELTRALADRAERVVAVDLSAEMLDAARRRCADRANVAWHQADIRALELPRESFDVVLSVATFHHLPLRETLERVREALRPGGTLALLDLVRDRSPLGVVRELGVVPFNIVGRRLTTGSFRVDPAYKEAWDAHWLTDRISSLAEVRAAARAALPGARVRVHWLWRYSLIWTKR